jgi:hypothetical protein
MQILMDEILTECTDQAYGTARLGRNGVRTTRDRLLAELLAELEASGDAIRRRRASESRTPQSSEDGVAPEGGVSQNWWRF